MTLVGPGPIERWRSVLTGVTGAPYYTNWYTAGSTMSEGNLDDVEGFWTGIRDHLVGTATVTVEGTVTLIDPATGNITGTETAGSNRTITGNASGGPIPPANQALMRWSTGEYVSGRQLQGRTFIGALSVSANASGFVAGGVIDALEAQAALLLGVGGGDPGGFNGSMCVWSRTHGVAAYITAVDVPSEFAVLRSRRD